jgi:hypothetical protein
VIIFITGPSGIGKTDTCFNLLSTVSNSVYLDSDWFSIKSPIDPLSKERIAELYDLLAINMNYHITRNTKHFFIAIYLEAVERLLEYYDPLLALGQKIKLVLLTCSKHTIENRVMSRDRIYEQKQEELKKISTELKQIDRMVDNIHFDILLDTSDLSARQVAVKIIESCSELI